MFSALQFTLPDTLLLLPHCFRVAVTVDDAGLVMASVGGSGVIVSIGRMQLSLGKGVLCIYGFVVPFYLQQSD